MHVTDRPEWCDRSVARKTIRTLAVGVVWLAGWAPGVFAWAAETITHPLAGVTCIVREDALPRPVKMHLLLIDLKTPGLQFRVTPHAGTLDTIKQTTLDFLKEQKAQLAINGHFFEPWPAPKPDPGTADLIGLAASDGRVYSPFEAAPPKSYAIRANAPALNIDRHNAATIVHRNQNDPTGRCTAEPVTLYNTLAGNEQLLTRATHTAGIGAWDRKPGPLTIVGLAPANTLVILIVDGRQPGVSEGLSTREAANLLLRDYHVSDAINLDGGGSTTFCMQDPVARVVNVPVGRNDTPGTLRPVGSNLAIFAPPGKPPPTRATAQPAANPR
ncbi:MAG: phosphodiester glycosidase family protein [Verrucomicrobia bacterium]|nr:phosphodiester glycosidase family protein [Verrucomicrobiota bacterium]